MSHRALREAAKFCAGIVTADLCTFLYQWSNNIFPMQTWGILWLNSAALPRIVFSLALILILIHYGWYLGKIPRPKERTYLFIIGTILTVIAVGHLARIFVNGEVVALSWVVPLWLSWVGTVVASYLAYASFYFAARSK